MSQSYVSCLMHYVFSTKERNDWINPELKERLYPYFGGIAKTNRMKMLAAGGTANHVHLLLSISNVPIPKAPQLIKGGSSKWIHDNFPALKHFCWQKGYGAFSINVSHIQDTSAYIQRQEEHHRGRCFKEEFVSFLKKHNIDYDERYYMGLISAVPPGDLNNVLAFPGNELPGYFRKSLWDTIEMGKNFIYPLWGNMDVVFVTQGSLRQPRAEISIPFGEYKRTLNSY